jgi:DNA processing protein
MVRTLQTGGMHAKLQWLCLKHVPGIGCLLYNRLLERFGSPQKVLAAARHDLIQVEGVGPRLAEAICRSRPSKAARHELALAEAKNITILTIQDKGYPRLLKEIPDPPPFVYISGNRTAADSDKAVAIVGSRMATSYGMRCARRIGRALARRGITVVSGMARGIDTAAHLGALDVGGKTIAVLGSGLLNLYPPQNRPLAGRIARQGALISEFPLRADPEAHHFPARNRIISGLSWGTVVVEASQRSGSLITARLAAEQNREVFAVPGSIDSNQSAGTHALIKQGAKLIEGIDDILEELPMHVIDHALDRIQRPPNNPTKSPAAKASAVENQILETLDVYPLHIDEIVKRIKLDTGKVLSLLLQMELRGLVRQDEGKCFSKVSETVQAGIANERQNADNG